MTKKFKNSSVITLINRPTCDYISAAILCRIAKHSVGISDEKLGDDCLHADTLQYGCTALHLLQFLTPSHTQKLNTVQYNPCFVYPPVNLDFLELWSNLAQHYSRRYQ